MARGDITWHAFPHNAQLELFDPSLLGWAVGMTHELDRRFGLPNKLTMSQVWVGLSVGLQCRWVYVWVCR